MDRETPTAPRPGLSGWVPVAPTVSNIVALFPATETSGTRGKAVHLDRVKPYESGYLPARPNHARCNRRWRENLTTDESAVTCKNCRAALETDAIEFRTGLPWHVALEVESAGRSSLLYTATQAATEALRASHQAEYESLLEAELVVRRLSGL